MVRESLDLQKIRIAMARGPLGKSRSQEARPLVKVEID